MERHKIDWDCNMQPDAIKFIVRDFLSQHDLVEVLECLLADYGWLSWPCSIGFSFQNTVERRITRVTFGFREVVDDDPENEDVCDGNLLTVVDVSKSEFFEMIEEVRAEQEGRSLNAARCRELVNELKANWVPE